MINVEPLNFTVMDNSMLDVLQNAKYSDGMSFFEACFSSVALPYTLIMILLLIGLCVAAWKARRWVRHIGRLAMAVVVLQLISGYTLLVQCYQWLAGPHGQWSNLYLAQGMKPVFCVAIIGLIIYMISLFISIAQKPRI